MRDRALRGDESLHRSLITRPATAEDVPAILRQRRLMFESMGVTDAVRLDEAAVSAAAYLARAIPAGTYRGWLVTTCEGSIVAGAGLTVIERPGSPHNPCGRSSYLMSLYVEPAYRRQGIARHLAQKMIAWSRAQGIGLVSLHASEQGRPLYESLGFRPTNEMTLHLDTT